MKTIPKIVFAVLLLLPFSLSIAQIYNDDYSKLQKFNLYKDNKVWMVYGWTFFYPKGVQEKKGKKTSFERFDRNGNRSEEVYYDAKGNSSYTCEYLYDDNGNEIKKMGGTGDDIVYDKWIYAFADNGRTAERKSEFKKGKDAKWTFAYDDKKNITEEIYYDGSGTMSYKWDFDYDTKQNVTEKQELDSYGNVYQKWVYKYDDKGNNIEMNHYVSNNQLYKTYQMRYDKKGNVKSKFTLDKDDKIIELTIYVYQYYQGLHSDRTLGNKQ